MLAVNHEPDRVLHPHTARTTGDCNFRGPQTTTLHARSPCSALFAPRDGASRGIHAWSGKIAAGETVYLRDVTGDIRVEAAAGDTLEVVGTERKPAGDTLEVTAVARQGNDSLTFCAIFPETKTTCEAEGRCSTHDRGDGGHRALDFVVKLPRGVLLYVNTVRGDVEVRGATATARAQSVQGNVRVEATGAIVDASSVQGDVTVRSGGGGDVAAETVHGNVRVVVPAALDATVRAETVNGSIASDFGLQVESGPAHRGMRGKLGGGKHRVNLSSVNGSIELRKP